MMRKTGKWDDPEDDWSARKPIIQSSGNIERQKGQAKWIISGVVTIVVLYALLAVFSSGINTADIVSEHKFIPNSPNSMGGQANIDKTNSANKQKSKKTDCKNQWTSVSLVGRCFGLSIHSKYSELGNIEVVESPEECKALCCELGDKCVTWQYWNDNKRCNLGPAVLLGAEADATVDGSSHWCEVDPPVVWRGRRIQSRDGPHCEWGDSLPTQCHGLGAERRGDDGNRLARAVCERACCHTAGCTMWQQHPERGCFVGTGENVICESYTGTFSGGMKKVS